MTKVIRLAKIEGRLAIRSIDGILWYHDASWRVTLDDHDRW